jgi:hypothetical protein
MSPLGNASGSRSTLIATYCAVHFPISGISRNRFEKSLPSTIPSNRICPPPTARANARSVAAVARGTPALTKSASASFSGVGKICVNQFDVARARPHAFTTRPAIVVASFGLVSCPRIARTVSSKSLQHPGTRNPLSASTNCASSGSFRSVLAITAQSESKSNIFRIRSITKKRERGSPKSMRTASVLLFSLGQTSKYP